MPVGISLRIICESSRLSLTQLNLPITSPRNFSKARWWKLVLQIMERSRPWPAILGRTPTQVNARRVLYKSA